MKRAALHVRDSCRDPRIQRLLAWRAKGELFLATLFDVEVHKLKLKSRCTTRSNNQLRLGTKHVALELAGVCSPVLQDGRSNSAYVRDIVRDRQTERKREREGGG